MTSSDSQEHPAPSYRKLVVVGFVLCFAGPGIFGIQILLRALWTPWYMPALCSVGALLMLFATIRQRGAWRVLGTVVGLGLAAFAWMSVLEMRLPPYSGAVQPGMPLPPFTVMTSDGDAFTQKDLRVGGRSVLVAYRSW